MAAHRLAKPADQPAPRPVWHAWVCRAELARSRVAPCARRRHSALGLPSPAVAAHTLPAVPTAFDLAAVLRHSLADRRLAGRPQLRHPSVRQVEFAAATEANSFPSAPPNPVSALGNLPPTTAVVEAGGIDDAAVGNCCATDTLGCIRSLLRRTISKRHANDCHAEPSMPYHREEHVGTNCRAGSAVEHQFHRA